MLTALLKMKSMKSIAQHLNSGLGAYICAEARLHIYTKARRHICTEARLHVCTDTLPRVPCIRTQLCCTSALMFVSHLHRESVAYLH